MNVQDYFSPTMQDYDLPRDFVKSCHDQSAPIAVVANGGSLQMLTDAQISNINKSRLYRCNWAFQDPLPIKKQYAIYFSQALGGSEESPLRDKLNQSIDDGLLIYRTMTNVLYNHNLACSFRTKQGAAVWATSGTQMMTHASFMTKKPHIYVAGMDMYSYKRPRGRMTPKQVVKYLKTTGKTFSESPGNSVGSAHARCSETNLTFTDSQTWINSLKSRGWSAHYIEIDVLLLMHAFANIILKGIDTTIYHSPNVSYILDTTEKNLQMVTDYFNQRDLNTLKSNKITYNMWRLVNQTVDYMIGY